MMLLLVIGELFLMNPAGGQNDSPVLLKPARVFDGTSTEAHAGWVVLVRGQRIEAAGPANQVQAPPDARIIDLPGMTLLPGLIEGHSHLFLQLPDLPAQRRLSDAQFPRGLGEVQNFSDTDEVAQVAEFHVLITHRHEPAG